jgi:hypothetical protein
MRRDTGHVAPRILTQWGNRLKTTYVLVDFENVQPKGMELLAAKSCKLKVFIGATQSKISVELAEAVQPFGPDAEYVRSNGSGSNAVDFHIAYYVGRLAAVHPDAEFYVISRDAGFDPLMKHLQSKGIECQRLASVVDIPLINAAGTLAPDSLPDRVRLAVAHLEKIKACRPRTITTLSRSLTTLFSKQVTNGDVEDLISQLIERGLVRVSGSKVSYP